MLRQLLVSPVNGFCNSIMWIRNNYHLRRSSSMCAISNQLCSLHKFCGSEIILSNRRILEVNWMLNSDIPTILKAHGGWEAWILKTTRTLTIPAPKIGDLYKKNFITHEKLQESSWYPFCQNSSSCQMAEVTAPLSDRTWNVDGVKIEWIPVVPRGIFLADTAIDFVFFPLLRL